MNITAGTFGRILQAEDNHLLQSLDYLCIKWV